MLTSQTTPCGIGNHGVDFARKLKGNSRIPVASILRGVTHELGGNDNEIQSGWNKDIAPRGPPSLCKTQVSLRSMVQTIQHEGQGILLDFGQLILMTMDEDSQT